MQMLSLSGDSTRVHGELLLLLLLLLLWCKSRKRSDEC
jgi:hypothetical protein